MYSLYILFHRTNTWQIHCGHIYLDLFLTPLIFLILIHNNVIRIFVCLLCKGYENYSMTYILFRGLEDLCVNCQATVGQLIRRIALCESAVAPTVGVVWGNVYTKSSWIKTGSKYDKCIICYQVPNMTQLYVDIAPSVGRALNIGQCTISSNQRK